MLLSIYANKIVNIYCAKVERMSVKEVCSKEFKIYQERLSFEYALSLSFFILCGINTFFDVLRIGKMGYLIGKYVYTVTNNDFTFYS